MIALHVLAVLLLSLPRPDQVHNPRIWDSPNTRHDVKAWAKRLNTSAPRLLQRLKSAARRYTGIRGSIIAPFEAYAEYTAARQGWSMFASPQKHPVVLEMDGLVEGVWRPLVRPRDPELDWRLRQLEHNRIRKLLGRFGRTFTRPTYRRLARWFATQALDDLPGVHTVRVRLYQYATPTPAQVRAGAEPRGQHRDALTFDREAAQ